MRQVSLSAGISRGLSLLMLVCLLLQNPLTSLTADRPAPGAATAAAASGSFARLPAAHLDAASQPPGGASTTRSAAGTQPLNSLPLAFEPNVGQTDPAVHFLVHTPGGILFFTPAEIVLALTNAPITATTVLGAHTASESSPNAAPRSVVRLQFVGANGAPELTSGGALTGRVNYFAGSDPQAWQADIPTYAGVTYAGLYPGIDLAYAGANGHLKSTYTVAAGADPGRIRWHYQGANAVQVDTAGNLQVRVDPPPGSGRAPITMTEQIPLAWQVRGDQRVPVRIRYAVNPDNSVRFALGPYDATQPLAIDPTLVYSTYLGGSADDRGRGGIAVDSSGQVYVTGDTYSTNFPTANPIPPPPPDNHNAFITKLKADGSGLLYSTYLGGNSDDAGEAIAVDASGNAYVTGGTLSTNFPIVNGYQTANGGTLNTRDAFVVKISATGSLLYSTYLGGSSDENPFSLALDSSSNVYITGFTNSSTGFPIRGAYQSSAQGLYDAFVAKLNPATSGNASLIYSSYFGGSSYDVGLGIAVDGANNAYIDGWTSSTNLPTASPAPNTPYQPQNNGGRDAFVSKLSFSGASLALVYSTYLGGGGDEDDPISNDLYTTGGTMTLDASGNAYITGFTYSSNFPILNAIQATNHGSADAFVTELNPTGSALVYSTYLGGSSDDEGRAIARDGAGNIYLTGRTFSAGVFPLISPTQYQAGGYDAFVTKLKAGGATFVYSTYLGGSGEDGGRAIAIDAAGNAYVSGYTNSLDFPSDGSPYQSVNGGGYDAFVTKLTGEGQPPGGPTAGENGGPGSNYVNCPVCHHTPSPVNGATGNFWHTFTDLTVPGRGIPLEFARTYNAQAANVNGPLGYGWTHSYNEYIDSDSTNYYVHDSTGSVVAFPKSGSLPARVLAQFAHNPDGTFVLTATHGLDRSFFGADGKLTKIADRNNYTTTLSYNAGQLRTVTDPVGRTLTFTYTGSLLTSVGDSSGRQVSFDYMNGELTSATDVGNQETQFSYYAGHLLHTMQDPRGGLVSNAYYADNRVQTQTDPMSRTVQFEYTAFDSLHSQTKVTDNLGNDTLYVYDENRLTLRVENPGDPRQAVWRYTYDPNYPTGGATATDPNGHTTRNTWDSQGNLLEFDNALGLPTTYAYNGTNDLLVVTSTVNLTTTFTYDPNGNVLSITQPVKETSQLAVTQFGYDPLHPGDVLTVTNPLNNSWRTTYDSYGYVLSTTDPLTETTRFTHDPLGRLLSVVDPLTHTASLAYNPYGAVTSITDTLGYTTTYSYDANQNLQTITNTKGLTTTYTYDLGNEVTRVTYPDGTHSDTGYDGNGRVISQTNPLTQTTLYDYDAFNRLNRVTDPLTHITRYDYDLAGNLLSVTDPLTYTTYYGYDAANQLSVIKHSDGLTPDVSIDQRDTLGRITQMTDGSGTTYYSYDSLNRLVQVQNGANAVVGYQYDLANNLTRIIYPGALKSVVRGYDAANRLRTVKDWLNHTTQFDYDATGALSSQTYPNGVQLKIGRDAAGQVISMTHAITATPFLSMTYGHDKLGLLNSANEAGAGADSYTYDTRSRLVGDQFTASTPISRTWSYDGATEITATRYQLGVQTPITTTRSYDAADELRSLVEQQGTTTTKNLSFSYDDKGNRISQADSVNGTASSYSYDQANRLITYNGVWQYVYDGNGLRVKKVGLGGTTNFTWDLAAGLPLLLADGSANYIYGPGGQILEQIQGSTAYYYHADRLGSVRALTNQAGAVVATYTYDAYGATTASTGSLANPFRYTGEYQDAESGLYYLRARYYDPASQQFLTRDPLLAVTGQAYNYAGGSPLNATDPLGLAKAIPMDGGGSGGGDVVIGASVGLWTLSLWASHQLGDAAAAWLQATANTIDQAIQGNPDDDWNIVTVFRGCNGTYPGAFKLRTDRDPDGYSAFETPQPGHDIQIPFVILYRGQKVSGTEGIFLDPSLRAAGIARYTPELGGEGHWSLQFKGPDGNPISDARQLLSEYAKRMGIPNLP